MGNKKHPDITCFVLSSRKNFFEDVKIKESDEDEEDSNLFETDDE